ASKGGLGLLMGMLAYIPTGRNPIAMGEGALAAEPFVAFSLTSFSTSLTVNLAYRFRRERTILLSNDLTQEQDDDFIWRLALRVPKDEDVAWSLWAEGTIGMATDEGAWPAAHNRPLWLGGSIDYPVGTDRRLALFGRFLVNGPDPGMQIGVQWSGLARDRDEDRDGILLRYDLCPMLKEDLDGFKDEDGCPDPDNDMDSFPDKEDACPLKKGDDYSTDGC
ncbi:MAG: hypothetical protein JXX14_21735, partial [Deltaproteobacteria bacterium]|nr:hypothetical protein [Deltaproteobacteria bacterium]